MEAESNKSKGVEAISPDDIKTWFQLLVGGSTPEKMYEEMAKHPLFAHPQQSEGVAIELLEGKMNNYVVNAVDRVQGNPTLVISQPHCLKCNPSWAANTMAPRTAGRYKCSTCGYEYDVPTKAEGVGATDSICGDLKDRQAAEGLVARCYDCGLPYASFGLDTTLPNEQWSRIGEAPAGLLCANCICKRAASLPGAIAMRAYVDFGQPSEPAALKEPQGNAPAVVITDGGIEGLWKRWKRYDETMYYDHFKRALKEFASLLNQKLTP